MDILSSVLKHITDKDTASHMMKYISSIQTAEDIKDYLHDFLDINNESHMNALNAAITSKFGVKNPEMVAYRKGDTNPNATISSNFTNDIHQTPLNKPVSKEDSGKKKKFVPLFDESGESPSVILPGRHACDCLASKHPLVNNCLGCGRIICSQEGSGPCFFCNELVCTREEQQKIAMQSKKGDQLKRQLMQKEWTRKDEESSEASKREKQGLEAALAHKQRLLEFDRTSARRTRVIDDEMDYYNTDANVWISPEEQVKLRAKENELREKRHAPRSSQPLKISLDLAGRRVIEEDTRAEAAHDLYRPFDEDEEQENRENMEFALNDTTSLVNSNIGTEPPEFVEEKKKKSTPNKKDAPRSGMKESSATSQQKERKALRLQDNELRELRDDGLCLSMHQPWASLLVHGVKKDEGRTWYSAHRGKLWIAAASRPATDEEIATVEQQYMRRGFTRDDFPKVYPIGCLLGCVDMADCLPQEEYVEKYPNGDSESPFVFVCENPQILFFKFPVKGMHKIFKLESHIHQAAKRGLR